MKIYKNFVTSKKYYRACYFDNDYMHAYNNFTDMLIVRGIIQEYN